MAVTALSLLLSISAVFLAQLGIGAGLALRRQQRRRAEAVPTVDAAAVRSGVAAWPGWRDFRVTRRVYEDPARSQCSFELRPADGRPLPPFQPGQYLTFSLQVPGVDTAPMRTVVRCYSLSDAPDPAAYRVTVKRMLAPAGQPGLPAGVASGHLLDDVHEGELLRVMAPAGRFLIDPDPAMPVVLVAGGIGITPLMSMLRWCLANQPQRPIHLFYGVAHGGECAFRQDLADLARDHPAFHAVVLYSRARPEDQPGRDYLQAGHVDAPLLARLLPPGHHQFYVCGPPAMMTGLVPALRAAGVPDGDIHFEAFGPASMPPPQPVPGQPPVALQALGLQVRFAGIGRTLVWDGQDANLLDFAERQGVEIASGCRTGSCGSCETRVVSGTVSYPSTPDFEVAPGCCLLCVGVPQTALVLQ